MTNQSNGPDLETYVQRSHIAYFTMEIALRPEVHTYGGGLGILAGDAARSCGDLELPVVFVSLVSRAGYVRQEIDAAGRQVEHPDPWPVADFAKAGSAKIAIPLEGREVWIRPWLYELRAPIGYSVPVLLLDCDLDENAPEDRRLTDELYGGDLAYRLKQEAVLGIGGYRMLQALGFEIHTYHLNEGHAALLTFELLRRFRRDPAGVVQGESAYDLGLVRERCVFTTHTPVEAGHDVFGYDLVARVLGERVETEEMKLVAGADALNMTRLALNLSGYVNGVAERHASTTRRLFPGYSVHAISNGVHPGTWVYRAMAEVFDAHLPNWGHEPELLVRAEQIPDEPIAAAHKTAKENLLRRLDESARFDPDLPVLGFARRMTGYKRPDLLFCEIDRLVAIAERNPFQVVLSGKAHPRDDSGKRLIEQIHLTMRRLEGKIPIAFLANYDMRIAQLLVAGCDVWLNTPLPPLEASGTSGMKAALNGVLNLSVLDGWWIEGCIEGVTGWSIGEDDGGDGMAHARALYEKLDKAVLPQYCHDQPRWLWMMKQSISKLGYYFNSQRMMRRYATEAYLR